MSRAHANTEKTAGTLENVARPDNLHWDVFVTPGIPIVTRDKPPDVRETFFQALRQDAGAASEPGQSRVGAMEFSTRSQALSPERAETPPMFQGRDWVGARNNRERRN